LTTGWVPAGRMPHLPALAGYLPPPPHTLHTPNFTGGLQFYHVTPPYLTPRLRMIYHTVGGVTLRALLPHPTHVTHGRLHTGEQVTTHYTHVTTLVPHPTQTPPGGDYYDSPLRGWSGRFTTMITHRCPARGLLYGYPFAHTTAHPHRRTPPLPPLLPRLRTPRYYLPLPAAGGYQFPVTHVTAYYPTDLPDTSPCDG